MKHLAEMFSVTKLSWDFFGTLTFCEPFLRKNEGGKANYLRVSKFNQFGRIVSGRLFYTERRWQFVPWILRLEQGEIGGLWHFHFLMQSLERKAVNIAATKVMESTWLRDSGGGFTKIRLFDKQQNGVEYVTKCLSGGDEYEFKKFGDASALTFSTAAINRLAKLSYASTRECSVLQSRVLGRNPELKQASESCNERLQVGIGSR